MSNPTGAIVIDTNRCKGCELCVIACPRQVIALDRKKVNINGYHYAAPVNAEACTGCTSCAIVCPDACISVYRCKK